MGGEVNTRCLILKEKNCKPLRNSESKSHCLSQRTVNWLSNIKWSVLEIHKQVTLYNVIEVIQGRLKWSLDIQFPTSLTPIPKPHPQLCSRLPALICLPKYFSSLSESSSLTGIHWEPADHAGQGSSRHTWEDFRIIPYQVTQSHNTLLKWERAT